MQKKVEQLPEILASIHSASFIPFYENEDCYNLWEELDEKTSVSGDVDKEFFRNISNYVEKQLILADNKTEFFAEILWDIHAKRLVPFYKTEEEFNQFSNDPEDSFFTRVGRI